MKWHNLDKEQTDTILAHVANAADPSLFSSHSSEARFKPLSFYQDYMVYRIVNYTTLPSFSLDFLSDGENFLLLDGTPSPINIANIRGSLYLTEANVIDYADFYLANIHGEDGDIYMIRNPEELPFIDSLSLDQQIDLKNKHIPASVKMDKNTGDFIIRADLFYGGTLLQADITVTPSGDLSIQPHEMIMSAAHSFGGI